MHAYTLNNWGVIKEKQGRPQEAEKFYRSALKKSPENHTIKWNLACVLRSLGKTEESKRHHGTAVFGLLAAYGASALLYSSDKVRIAKADANGMKICAVLSKPQTIDPVAVYEKLGVDFLKKDQLALAEESFQKAARASPTSAFLRRVGGIKCQHGLIEDAIEWMKKFAEINPNNVMVHVDLGLLYSKLWKTDEVVGCLEKAFGIVKCSNPLVPDPWLDEMLDEYIAQETKITRDYNTGVYELWCYLRKVANWKDFEKHTEQMTYVVGRNLKQSDALPAVPPEMSLMFPLDDDLRKQIAVRYAQKVAAVAQSLGKPSYQYPKPDGRERRVKVGYVLGHHDYDGDYENLASMDAVIGKHDRSKVEVFVYVISSEGGEIDSVVEHLSKEKDDGKMADRIHADRIDILISMTEARNAIFALRPAPIQVAWLGNRGTSGGDFVDYVITDRVATPLESARFFTEKLAYMPNSCYVGNHAETFPDAMKQKVKEQLQPPGLFRRMLSWFDLTSRPTDAEETTKEDHIENDDARIKEIAEGRKRYGLPEKAIVYGSFGSFYKCDPETADMWARILKRVPSSVLWLTRDPVVAEPNVRQFFQKDYNIGSHRILFCDVTTDEEELMRRGRLVDVYLDTTMWNAGAMGLDILWLGVPMVTWPGKSLVSRISTSQLNGLGCPELVATSRQEYIKIAVGLGKDPEKLRKMRTKITKARSESESFDVEQYCRDFEELLFNMWRRYKNFMKPDHIME